MSLFSEKSLVEDYIIQELQKLGWSYVSSEQMKTKRNFNFEDPLILEDLKSAIKKINHNIEFTDADLNFISSSLRIIPPNLEGIRIFLGRFKTGLVVPIQNEKKERLIKLVDLEYINNNNFVVTNQFRVDGQRGNIRADIVLIVNGIPLVLIECKSPTAGDVDWVDAYRQIKRYEDQTPELFKYIQFSIATDGTKTYYFPNAFRREEEERGFLAVWKDPFPFKIEEFGDDKLKVTLYGLLSKSNLLDIIENFIFVRKEHDKTTKVMARYMQFRTSNKIFQRVISTLERRGEEKFGLIWHWQGSGKTYTMAFSAWKLLHSPQTEKPSIFVVVDRTDLEEQIERDFSFIEVPIEKIHSIKELLEILKWGREGKRGIFLVTIEKFSPKTFEELNAIDLVIERENVIVLADEVHRTQYGKFATLMRSVFKRAFMFGFTGTPLSKSERNTFAKFCPKGELYLDRYSMLDAMNDGFTVPLSYEARLPQYNLNRDQLEELMRFEEEEIRQLSEDERRELRRKINVIKTFVKKQERVDAIAKDVAEHFREVVEPTGLKSLLVAIDREACILYNNAIKKYLPESYSEVVMTFSPNDNDMIRNHFEELYSKYGTKDLKELHQKIIYKFKFDREPKILIVTDMLITGFDAPNLWTMYLDKPLKEHRLLQAIARTNRPFSNKRFGLIVDYIGILAELESAFERFEASDAKDLRLVIMDLEKEKERFVELLAKCLKIFEDIRRDDPRKSLDDAMDVLINPDKAREFETTMKDLMRSYEMLSGYPFLKDYLSDYVWLSKIYVCYNKKFKKRNVDELKIEDLSKKTINLIQKTLDVSEVESIYPTITIDAEYVDHLKRTKPKTMGQALDLGSNIIHEVRNHPNSPFFINLGISVERTYEDLREKKIETEEAIRKFIEISEKISQWKREEAEIGKNKYPLYEVIKLKIPDIDKQKALEFVNRLLTHLKNRKLLFKGWQLQRDVRRKVAAEVRVLTLSEFKNYKNKIDEITDGIFEALEGIEWN
ncbi:MAG: HsdR family type I site-specific deoxyribonuclease [Nitrososphaerota archaeon]